MTEKVMHQIGAEHIAGLKLAVIFIKETEQQFKDAAAKEADSIVVTHLVSMAEVFNATWESFEKIIETWRQVATRQAAMAATPTATTGAN